MKHLDLFSGIGGFALAARWAGIETVAFCEKDEFCQKVLRKHWPNLPIHDDIKSLHYINHFDLLTAGFPCQPFSVAGKQKGKDDDRYLWPEVIRIIRECGPSWCILENVPGIIPHLDTILEDLEREGYAWRAFLIPAVAVGAPHKRERLWIVANSNSVECNQGTKNNETKSIRQEWAQSTPEIGNVACDPYHIPSSQTNSCVMPKGISRETWQDDSSEHRANESKTYWEENQPPVPGVDDGLPNGMDRNKSLGNAIVPQIAYLLMRMIQNLYP